MRNALRFNHTDIERKNGEMGRLRVLYGVDRGAIFLLMNSPVFIGRGEENDIIISDLKSSRVHVKLEYDNHAWSAQDLGSSNGLLYNGVLTKKSNLKYNDTIMIGETIIEFIPSHVGTKILNSPMREVKKIQDEYDKIKKKLFFSELSNGLLSSYKNSYTLKKKFILGLGAVFVIFFLFGDLNLKSKKKIINTDKLEKIDFASFLPVSDSSNKTVDTLFKDGFREYLSGHYARARVQFETVLQIVPGHVLATLYLENCHHSVESSVKLHLEIGKKSFEAGKLRDARANYSRVMQLLYRDQLNSAFLEAKEQLEKVMKKINNEEAP